MITELNDEATEYGRLARQALEAAGGDALAPRAEEKPLERAALVEPALDELGAWDLDPRARPEEAEAAAALCRAAGWWALAYPVAERLARRSDLDADGLVVVDPRRPVAAVAGLDRRWAAVDLDGHRYAATPTDGHPLNPRKDGYAVPLDLDPLEPSDGLDGHDGHDAAIDAALALVLPCWTLLGLLDRAVELTAGYVQERRQFGKPLAAFQAVQFQLTEAEVERVGLEELAKHALWGIQTGAADALVDALALRVAALDAADVVLRVAHQLHGAIGFCDETTISWHSRASVAIRRYPFGPSASRAALTAAMGRRGLTGLFTPAP